MPTNKQRREAERRHLERQLQNRRVREAHRRKMTLIISVSMTIVLIAAIVVVVLIATGGSDKKKNQAGGNQSKPTPSHSATTSPSPSASLPQLKKPAACAAPPKKIKSDTVTFKGVTVKNATNLKTAPTATSTSSTPPNSLECQDLVVGKGPKATAVSTVSVQYLGVLYDNGTKFDSSWDRGGKPISFSLQQVVPGFTQGIGGAGKLAPMRVGGRRVIIVPSQLGYGATAQQTIPANSSLVFVIDLTKVTTPGASSGASASAPANGSSSSSG
ncbi:MAG TPA: FKBP-type peptidyl-prolyl cis-trans isomerase [Jatrophihabitantaceae bacterium]